VQLPCSWEFLPNGFPMIKSTRTALELVCLASAWLGMGLPLAQGAPVKSDEGAWFEKTFALSKTTPAVAWSFSKEADRLPWKFNKDVTLTATADGVQLKVAGGDPMLVTSLPSSIQGPCAVKVVCRQKDEMSYLEFYPAGGDGKFGAREFSRRMVLGGPEWQDVWFLLEAKELKNLRLDPEGGKRELELKEIAIYPLKAGRAKDHPVLPKSDWNNTFYMVPIHETFDDARYNDAARKKDLVRLKEEFGPGRLYMREGFSASSARSWNKSAITPLIPLLEDAGMVWHAHHHVGNHSIGRYPVILDAVKRDRRNAAWRADGNCGGVATSWADSKVFNEEGLARTSVLACVSRLNTDVVNARLEAARWLNVNQGHAAAAKDHAEVMISAGCSVENELPMSPQAWGCYSPWSVQEFQDWLRHRGIYARDGVCASQAAPEALTGRWIMIDGAKRSAFYDDPSPSDSHDTGPSFNDYFSTKFRNWKLEFWDFVDFPPGSLPWLDDLDNMLPAEGERGNLKDVGFDAPRVADVKSRFWLAWSNEDQRAPGYRQFSIWAWNQDVVADFVKTGFPEQHLFTHQIPAEFLSKLVLPNPDYRSGMNVPLLRRFTTASPLWTADDGKGAFGGFGLGITTFDYMADETVFARARAMDANWALLEYHPDSQHAGYYRSLDSLRALYRQRVHVLAPGWWGYKKPPFMLDGTEFAKAIKDWMNNPSGFDESDQPWNGDGFVDFTPPPVHGLKIEAADEGKKLTWSDRLWPDVRYATWALWREWQGGKFIISRQTTSQQKPEKIAEVEGNVFTWTDPKPPIGKVRYFVHAKRTAGISLEGASDSCTPGLR
jgi:hypothetical protein